MAAGNQVVLGKYEIGRLLGKGSFAKVYHAKKLSTGENVAVKVIGKDEVRKQGMQNQIQREISIMRLVRHPNIVNVIEVMATKSKIFVVMEYVRGGELFTRVSQGKLAEDEARKYFQQLISAVEFCHGRGVYHRDLKPENLLLDADGTLKVSDFGLSAFTDQLWLDGLLHTQCGTPAYVAPEVLRKHGYDGAKADIWSCGIILFVFLTGFLPFQDENVMRMYSKMFKNEFQFPRWISRDARRLISKLLIADPERRITISAIKRDVWFVKDFHSPPSLDEVDSDHGGVPVNDKCDKPPSPSFFNAFELISSISSGFDLSGLFESETRNRMMFTSRSSSGLIMARIEVAAKRKEFGTAKQGDGKLRLTSPRKGTKVPLTLTAEVFEVAPDVTVVELSKVAGDTSEYFMFCEEEGVRQTLTGLDSAADTDLNV